MNIKCRINNVYELDDILYVKYKTKGNYKIYYYTESSVEPDKM